MKEKPKPNHTARGHGAHYVLVHAGRLVRRVADLENETVAILARIFHSRSADFQSAVSQNYILQAVH